MVRYFGLRKQTAFNAPAAPNRFIDVLSANPNPSDERTFPPSLASRETTLWLPGRKYSEPELECYLFPEGLEGLFHSFFQSVTTTTLVESGEGIESPPAPASGFAPTKWNPVKELKVERGICVVCLSIIRGIR